MSTAAACFDNHVEGDHRSNTQRTGQRETGLCICRSNRLESGQTRDGTTIEQPPMREQLRAVHVETRSASSYQRQRGMMRLRICTE